MAEEKVNIKELKEALIAANEITIFIMERGKDGFGVDDAMALWSKLMSDEKFKALVVAGWEGRQKIGAEVSDIDLQEGLELAAVQLGYIPKIVNALKKDEVPV